MKTVVSQQTTKQLALSKSKVLFCGAFNKHSRMRSLAALVTSEQHENFAVFCEVCCDGMDDITGSVRDGGGVENGEGHLDGSTVLQWQRAKY